MIQLSRFRNDNSTGIKIKIEQLTVYLQECHDNMIEFHDMDHDWLMSILALPQDTELKIRGFNRISVSKFRSIWNSIFKTGGSDDVIKKLHKLQRLFHGKGPIVRHFKNEHCAIHTLTWKGIPYNALDTHNREEFKRAILEIYLSVSDHINEICFLNDNEIFVLRLITERISRFGELEILPIYI